jgi:S1-C subfamily serine protease
MLSQIVNKILFRVCALVIILLTLSTSGTAQPYKKEKVYIEYLLQNNKTTDFIEGIWKVKHHMIGGIKDKRGKILEMPMNIQTEYRIAIIKLTDRYFTYKCDEYFPDNIYESKDAECSNFSFEKTALQGQYLYELSGCDMFKNANGKAFIKSDGDLAFEWTQEENINGNIFFEIFKITATKVAPTQEEITNRNSQPNNREETELKPQFSFGTCFAISDNFLLTSYHVVKDAKNIRIRGIDGKFDTTYSAEIRYYDEEHDIAFLNISRKYSNQKVIIPYSIKQEPSDVGDNIFVLGYPLQKTMGQEIKLTTGIISSNSGFLGDTSLFQISAPIQPGNSGGPLFDNNGNLIGIIEAKYKNADNVGYAVKLSFIKNFLEEQKINLYVSKPVPIELPKKVKLFKDYIYSVEVELQ